MQTTRELRPSLTAARRAWAGFTLVEMLVVVSIIILLLAITLPGLSAMSADARMNGGLERVRAVLSRASLLARSKSTMVAVRFMPSEWDAREQGEAPTTGRQRIVLYEFVGATDRWNGSAFEVRFSEYFRRVPDVEPIDLPQDVWVAPIEALSRDTGLTISSGPSFSYPLPGELGLNTILNGVVGTFRFNPLKDDADSDFLDSDDFVIVFDPRTGLIGAGAPRMIPLFAFDPTNHLETEADPTDPNDVYQRLAATGVVVYRREPFLAAGNSTGDRQEHLRQTGRVYMVSRHGGALVEATGAP